MRAAQSDVEARTQSVLMAIGAGVALGVIGLVARYAPLDPLVAMLRAEASRLQPQRAAPSVLPGGEAMPDGEPRAAVRLAAPTSTTTPATDLAESAPVPVRTAQIARRLVLDRFADDPVARAACPPDMTLVDGEFCPSLTYSCIRVGNGVGHGCPEYARGAACRAPMDRRRFCMDRHEWPNHVGELPRIYVDWFEAKALCDEAGKRLCRRSEWILACEGPKMLPYPWGFVRTPSPCNIDRAAIEFDVGALINPSSREGELARLWQADPIGSHPDCISAFGAYDLAGNVDEWTDNLADDPSTPHPATLNGGYWGPVRNTCRLTTKGHGPTFKFYQVGFRCCAETRDGVQVPPPRPFVEREREARGVDE